MEQFSIPMTLVCQVTGQSRSFTNRKYLESKIQQFGSIEVFKKNYVIREAKTLLKEGKTPEEVRMILNQGLEIGTAVEGLTVKIGDQPVLVSPPKISYKFEVTANQPLTAANAPTDCCMNPGHFLDKKPCEDCFFAGKCQFIKRRTKPGKAYLDTRFKESA